MDSLNDTMRTESQELIRQYCRLNRRLHGMRASLKRVASHDGLNVSESIILLCCHSLAGNSASEGVPQQRLTELTGMSAALVSTQLAALTARGLMDGCRPASNRRIQLWTPSPRGSATARSLEQRLLLELADQRKSAA